MKSLCVAAAIVAIAAVSGRVRSQPLTHAFLLPAVDTPAEREALRGLALCVAAERPRWARNLLSHPYLSDAQADAVADIVSGRDRCVPGEQEFVFRTSTVVGALAEHFLAADLPAADPKRLSSQLATIAPLNASEDFALCIASRDPSAAMLMVRSPLGSDAEASAASQLASHLPDCTRADEHLLTDVQAMRALVATALYRAVDASAAAPR